MVGPDPNSTEFLIHKEVVCQQSEVLAAAFNSGFKEGQTQTYRLEDTTDRGFRLFMQWLYSRKFTLLRLDSDYDYDEDSASLGEAEDMSLVELWVLADKVGMPALQDSALEAIHNICDMPPGYIPNHTFHYIFENTSHGSPLREYTIATCLEYGSSVLLSEQQEVDFPRAFLLELSKRALDYAKLCPRVVVNVSDFFVQ